MSSTDNRKFKSAEGRREASAAEQLPPSANQRSPMIQLGLKKKKGKNKRVYKKTNKVIWRKARRMEKNWRQRRPGPHGATCLPSFQQSPSTNQQKQMRISKKNIHTASTVCVRSFHLSVSGIRGKEKKGNAHHRTSINYRRNRRPERKRWYFLHHCTIVLGLEAPHQSILHYS